MKKILFILTLLLVFCAISSEAQAQAPEVYALGFLDQTTDGSHLMVNFNAIESNITVYQVYDVDLIADYYENDVYLGGFQTTGINYAEIPVTIPATVFNTYSQFSYYSLRPVDICGGFVDYFGFSLCYGGNYLLPYTFNGGCAPICINVGSILLGAFLLQQTFTPVITLSSVDFEPTMATIGSANQGNIKVKTRITWDGDLPSNVNTDMQLRISLTDTEGLENVRVDPVLDNFPINGSTTSTIRTATLNVPEQTAVILNALPKKVTVRGELATTTPFRRINGSPKPVTTPVTITRQ